VIDVLGFHDERDYHAELATLQAEINALTSKVQGGRFYSYEDRHNTYGRLDNLTSRARTLTTEAAMEDQRIRRLADAVQIAGDADLGFIAYVVFGPQALPMQTLYEVRLVDEYGYTVPGTVRTNLPADRVAKASNRLMTVDGPAYARMYGRRWVPSDHQVQVTPF
jgi:hypothetical protein